MRDLRCFGNLWGKETAGCFHVLRTSEGEDSSLAARDSYPVCVALFLGVSAMFHPDLHPFVFRRRPTGYSPGKTYSFLFWTALALALLCSLAFPLDGAATATDTPTVTAPVRLPSGMLVVLNQKQVDVIKAETGVFFGATAADMLGPGEVIVSLPVELGGGHLYGRPEQLARAFAAARVTQGTTPATHLFTKPRSCLW